MEDLYGNMHAFMFKIYSKAQYFLHFVPPFTPHYVIMVKSLLLLGL